MAEGGPSPPGKIKSRLNAARKTLSKLLHPRFSAQDAPVSLEHSAQIGAPEGGNDRG
jgi:hypothetical protein